jgi:sporulation protein YlmC with PRC-barrel domain
MRASRVMTSVLALSLALPGLALAQATTTTPEATQPPPASAAPAPGMSTSPNGAATGMGTPMGTGTAAETGMPPATANPNMGMGTTTATDTMSPAWYASMQSDEIVGQDLYGANGEEIGEVNNVVLNQDGKQAAALVGVGGFLGIGEREVAIPLDEISRGQDNRLTTSMTRDAIGNLPAYEEGGGWTPLGTGRTIGEGVGQ